MAMFFSITPPEWRRLSEESSAFTRRLSSYVYPLDDFDEERVTELIKAYLLKNRVNNLSKEAVEREKSTLELYPFSEDSPKEIMRISAGRISSVIIICRKFLDYLIDHQQKYKIINKNLINAIIKEEGL